MLPARYYMAITPDITITLARHAITAGFRHYCHALSHAITPYADSHYHWYHQLALHHHISSRHHCSASLDMFAHVPSLIWLITTFPQTLMYVGCITHIATITGHYIAIIDLAH